MLSLVSPFAVFASFHAAAGSRLLLQRRKGCTPVKPRDPSKTLSETLTVHLVAPFIYGDPPETQARSSKPSSEKHGDGVADTHCC